MPGKNLSVELFKPRFKHPETSTLVRLRRHATHEVHSALDGDSQRGWYRMLNKLMWAWRGLPSREISEVLARIAISDVEHTHSALLDTVIGYRNGNWHYEWSRQAGIWQQRALDANTDEHDRAGHDWLHASHLYSVAAYPYIKGDELADQAQTLASRAYEEATQRLPGELKTLTFPIQGGSPVSGFLHMPSGVDAPYPTVMFCGALDSLQTDHYRLFHDYLAPRGIAMLTLDMPSVGNSMKWKLSQDTSFLHQQVLRDLTSVPWIDHTRVAALGFRFGANVAVRLAYLESQRLKAVACLGPIVHSLLTQAPLQNKVPDMYMDMLASRLGMTGTTDSALRAELLSYSLKNQGLLGRRTSTPMLSAYWTNDLFSPEEESKLIASSSSQGKALLIPVKPVIASFDKALNEISDWLAQCLQR
ncbi:esterase FrsA [Pantoea ananatis]|uniref:esterase FrsA n=1 Tax=Pantoea ananas TaxID=553 RepID=UPI000DA6D547|nr:esterase FrsA [Pantoea ananatis]PZD59308.1 esterase FrsA [Pantoea ananatis]PZD61262.1 esterase FrsA [Pantoea ananatis]